MDDEARRIILARRSRFVAAAVAAAGFAAVLTHPAEAEDTSKGPRVPDGGLPLSACDDLDAPPAIATDAGALVVLARCHVENGSDGKAYRAYSAALEVETDEARRAAILAARDELAGITVRASCEGNVDVRVLVDGEAIAVGTWVPVDIGERRLEVICAHGRSEQRILVRRGERARVLTLDIPRPQVCLTPIQERPSGCSCDVVGGRRR